MSQLAFHQLIAKAIERNFLTSPQVEEGFLHFQVGESGLSADIIMQAFEPEPGFQAVKICLWFCHPDGSRMNFSNIDFADALVLTNILAYEIEWGAILPWEYDETNIGISLTTTIDTEENDLEIMRNMDHNSILLRNMFRLCKSAEHVYPVLYGVSSGQITSFDSLEHFLSEETESTQ
jgi:hypothetical protein